MGNEAWEKAVEAGARAGSPAAFDAKNFVGIPHRREVAERFARESADHALRAAFPILAEGLVAWHDERAAHAKSQREKIPQYIDYPTEHAMWRAWLDTETAHLEYATSLRTRIEQMKEPS